MYAATTLFHAGALGDRPPTDMIRHVPLFHYGVPPTGLWNGWDVYKRTKSHSNKRRCPLDTVMIGGRPLSNT